VNGFWSLINLGIAGELRRGRFDAVIVHGHQFCTYVLAMAAVRTFGSRLFLRCETHDLLQRSVRQLALRRWVIGPAYRGLANACLAIGTRNREYYRDLGFPPERVFDTPYTVDNERFMRQAGEQRGNRDRLRRELGIAPGAVVVLYASKLIQRKRPMDLLRAFAAEAGNERAHLLFVGAGEQQAALEEFVRAERVPKVQFLGFRNQAELPGLLAAADVFALPSENEPWGLVINEAMCAGLPIVASREIGAVSDLIRLGENGFLFPAGDVAALQEALRPLLADAGLRRATGQRSLQIIREWGFDQTVAGILAALEAGGQPRAVVELTGKRLAGARS
jgi:glycosyltransferase involved in cell wall biosynthesis